MKNKSIFKNAAHGGKDLTYKRKVASMRVRYIIIFIISMWL
jgi:hypothetical protein